jgi:hypothetical protein
MKNTENAQNDGSGVRPRWRRKKLIRVRPLLTKAWQLKVVLALIAAIGHAIVGPVNLLAQKILGTTVGVSTSCERPKD